MVLATPSGQSSLTRRLVERGVSVVCTSDDVEDVRDLLELDGVARANNVSIVVGAAASPGLSGLLVAELASRVDVIDEIHVGVHGTGGPACARQHHRALAGEAPGWHDGQWITRPGGSGRELLWFPEPIGGRDCYRAELADPLTLQRAFPSASRISARMSATRRDRLTARLPMMSPPHAEGGIGGFASRFVVLVMVSDAPKSPEPPNGPASSAAPWPRRWRWRRCRRTCLWGSWCWAHPPFPTVRSSTM